MRLDTVAETEAAGAALAKHVRVGDVVALSGDLGAGKTSLVRGLLHALGLDGDVPSPSFGLVIPYEDDVSIPVWHVDLYRLEALEELEELALDEARDDHLLLVEWPERMGGRLWNDALHLYLEPDGEGRRLTATVPPSWEGRCPFR